MSGERAIVQDLVCGGCQELRMIDDIPSGDHLFV